MNIKTIFSVLFLICFFENSLISSEKNKIDELLVMSLEYRHVDLKQSLEYAKQALEMSKLLNDSVKISESYNEIGVINYLIGDYHQAIHYYEMSLDIDRKLGKVDDISMRLNNIAMSKAEQGLFSEAIDLLKEALSIDKKIGDSTRIATRYNNIGILYYRFNYYDNALTFFSDALKIDSIIGNTLNLSVRLSNIGKVWLVKEEPKKAISYYMRSLEIDKELQNEAYYPIRYSNLGQAYVLLKQYDLAKSYFEEALKYDIKFNNLAGAAFVQYYLGKMYLEQNNIKNANEHFLISIELAEKTKNYSLLIDLYKDMSLLKEQSGNIKEAFNYYKKFDEIRDSIFNQVSKQKISDFYTFFELEKKEKEIELLQKKQQINSLLISKKEEEIKRQRLFQMLISTVLVLVIVVILFLYYYYILKSKKKQLKLKQELNLYMQKALIQQMNPHFFFNTLNSIQYYILKNDKVTSNKYLSMFARLMRTTLNNSQNETIPLFDEVEGLKTYIELEQLRFTERFNYELFVHSNIDLNDIFIPPFIIQPYVENAIWHGLMPKSNGVGMLKISILLKNSDFLEIVIEDNGIGRKKSAELVSVNKKNNSLGTHITETRISLINQIYNNSMSVSYVDLVNSENEPLGTQVIILIGIQ